jgi:glycosyltransferase involved in cell wall biosynthesis
MKHPVHICHFTSVHQATDTRIFVKECRSLAKAGYRVTLVAAHAKMGLADGVEIIGVEVPAGRLARMWSGARAVYHAAVSVDADVYHFHDPELLRFVPRLRRRGKIVIYDSHEDLPRQIAHKYYIPALLKPLVARIAEWFENRYARRCSAVVTATPFIRDRFLPFQPVCVDVCNYPSLEELPIPVPFHQKERAACYIGSITEVRGIREKLAMMEDASFTLLLGGPFSPSSLLTEMMSLPGWKKIEYLGPLNRSQVIGVLKRARVGLVTLRSSPNYADALPVKMFEYMAAGIPVVTNCIPLWQKIVVDNHCGVAVDIHDSKKLREQIELLLNDESLSEAMGQRGRQAVEEKYNWAIEEKKLTGLYQQIIPAHG